ncbi:MAG: hypothetical protein AB7V50_03155 [Vampirovibrionia bacterium]
MLLTIESGSNTPLFIIAVLAIVLMWMGITTKKRIFNLFAVPALVYLAVYFSSSIPLIIMFVGLIIWNGYYAFIAEVVD